ncbi:choline/carnitine/betaine transport [Corynebacterium freneyi]|uniref:Choline/carnitine/betaine transport n=1 Tax=Corynebacterium freneyi TaxID=134034 RepID=A0ABS4U6P4_9CORY|nr:choline/carnitine/betaine transport [Corynebacterium freneyi]WJZ05567.1 Glycine betaine transporter OpuD [Corynebacterium freneyi]
MSLPESDKNKGSRPRDGRPGEAVPDDDGLGDITRGRKVPFRIDPPVFWPSVILILGFVAWTLVSTESVTATFSTAADWLKENLGWFYILGITVFLVFLIWIAMSRFGRIRLGGDDERPEHSTATWFAMLFAAGIGTILMFWGVAEPLNHFANPPRAGTEPLSNDAAREAMAFTFYHFGLHTWTIFALPGLAFAYFIYKRKLPARLSSILAPLIGTRIYGPIGRIVDVVAVVGTVFGVAVSIGLGTMQISAGLNRLYGFDESVSVQVLLIIIVSLIACVSVALGLDKGIKRLSNLNIVAAVLLLVFVLVAGPTLYLLRGTIEAIGGYLAELPRLALWNDAFDENPGWQGGWTVFYWAWTITWAPFVGIFVARISRGRTIREFVGGVLALPVAFSLIWFGIFGMASFRAEQEHGKLVDVVVDQGDVPGALFEFLSHFPFAPVLSLFSVIIVVIFFTTSMDSSSMVLDMMALGDENKSNPVQRVVWAVLTGLVAAILLVGAGEAGLTALQDTITVVGLPFFVLGFTMMISLVKGIRDDAAARPEPRTRQWSPAFTPDALESQESTPAPGYDEQGEPLPAPLIDDDGNLHIPGGAVIDGDVTVRGSLQEESGTDEN